MKDYEKKELLGSEYSFAVLFFPREELSMSLPAKKLDDSVREPLTQADAEELLSKAKEQIEPLNSSWKVRNRKNIERLASGDPVQLMTVLHGLQKLKDKKGSLNNSDRKHLTLSMELLIEEFSIALGESPEATKSRLEDVVLASPADAA